MDYALKNLTVFLHDVTRTVKNYQYSVTQKNLSAISELTDRQLKTDFEDLRYAYNVLSRTKEIVDLLTERLSKEQLKRCWEADENDN